jgi:hypothetical protein
MRRLRASGRLGKSGTGLRHSPSANRPGLGSGLATTLMQFSSDLRGQLKAGSGGCRGLCSPYGLEGPGGGLKNFDRLRCGRWDPLASAAANYGGSMPKKRKATGGAGLRPGWAGSRPVGARLSAASGREPKSSRCREAKGDQCLPFAACRAVTERCSFSSFAPFAMRRSFHTDATRNIARAAVGNAATASGKQPRRRRPGGPPTSPSADACAQAGHSAPLASFGGDRAWETPGRGPMRLLGRPCAWRAPQPHERATRDGSGDTVPETECGRAGQRRGKAPQIICGASAASFFVRPAPSTTTRRRWRPRYATGSRSTRRSK